MKNKIYLILVILCIGNKVMAQDYPSANWIENTYPTRYTSVAEDKPRTIDRIIIHATGADTAQSTINWFTQPDPKKINASSHYLIDKDGTIYQFVLEKDIAHHATENNADTIGIEIVSADYQTNPNWATSEIYQSAAKLVEYLCQKYNIPIDRKHIIGHSEIVPNPKGKIDPGHYWDWSKFMNLLKNKVSLEGVLDYLIGLEYALAAEITPARDPNEKLVYPEGDIKPGDRLDYTINYENEGEGIAYGVYITDILDRDLDDSTLIINNNGTYDPNTRTITWFIGEVDSHQKGSVTFSVNTKPDLPDGAEIINFATVYFPSVPEVTRTNGTVNRVVTAIPDTTPPETTLSVFPVANQQGWNNTDVTITLTSEDGSEVKEIHYILTGVETRKEVISGNTARIVISVEGITNLAYWAIDNAGNVELPKTLQIKIDKTPPTLTSIISPQPNFYGWNNTDVTVAFVANDTLSGVSRVSEPITVATEGENQYIVGEAIDFADNRGTTSVTVNIDKTSPQVNITANPNLLWPPNHKMVNVSIGGSASDALSGIALKTFEIADEYATVEPTISDFGAIIQLETWRNGDDLDGRRYDISVTTKDKADNETTSSITVTCPHDQRKK